MRILQLRYEAEGDSNVYKAGCIPSPENKREWIAAATPEINTVSRIKGHGTSHAHCNSIGNPKRFTITVRLTVTDLNLAGRFYCRGYKRSGGVGEVLFETGTLDVKGKHSQATGVFYLVTF